MLFNVRNTPGQFGLTPYELLYGGGAPLVKIASVHSADMLLSQPLFSRLKVLQWVRQRAKSSSRRPTQEKKTCYIRRLHQKTLRLRWKGPYLVLLTTLLSTFMGPLLILLLLLIIGPCVLNRQVTFIRTRISAVRLLVLRQQYHAIKDQVCQEKDSI